jgi:hypothetical protein
MPIYVPSDLYQYLSGRRHNVRPHRFLNQNKRVWFTRMAG